MHQHPAPDHNAALRVRNGHFIRPQAPAPDEPAPLSAAAQRKAELARTIEQAMEAQYGRPQPKRIVARAAAQLKPGTEVVLMNVIFTVERIETHRDETLTVHCRAHKHEMPVRAKATTPFSCLTAPRRARIQA